MNTAVSQNLRLVKADPPQGPARICLWFTSRDHSDGHELIRTLFLYSPLGYSIQAVRGRYSGAYPGASTFQWTSAVQAISIALVRAAARRTCEDQKEPLLSGRKGTLASSLDDALYKQTAWLSDIFGADGRGQSLANKLFKRSNPCKKQPGPVSFSLNVNVLSAHSITVLVDEAEVTESALLESLANGIERDWHLQRAAKPKMHEVVSQLPVRAEIRPIIFVSPAMESKPFYADALEKVIIGAAKIRTGTYTAIPKLPSKSFDSAELWSIFDGIAEGRTQGSGLLLLADDPDRYREKILSLSRSQRLPLVLFDVDMHREPGDEGLPPFVGGNEEQGGRIAAGIMVKHLATKNIVNPLVLILKGASTRWESMRSSAFSAELRDHFPEAIIIESDDLQYDRQRARSAALYCFEHMQRDGQVNIDAIFACNDDMGLGVRSAIIQASREGVSFKDHLKIVGYDGVKEMRDYIDNRDRWVLGTVDVKLEDQITLALGLLQEMIETGARHARKELVTPKAYVV